MTILHENQTSLNAQNPWPGLAAYEEESTDFFFGRDEEADELFQLIQQAPLTVVYGKSGLGKTSLLQAGLYPRLREQHYLPIHVRLQFVGIEMDSPLQQVMRRLIEEMDREKAEYPEPRAEGSLWEYLHRKDLAIVNLDNVAFTPVLVFDQFEELFSQKRSDIELITQGIYSLANLIENRIPHDLLKVGARTVRSSLDLRSQRYRIVLSFREDFLPEVKTWEERIPSLLRNCLRLNPMSRERAIEAVACAGKEVLDANVAPSIVDLVGKRDRTSDSASLSEMIIEPVLLSLCCSRLNARRTDGTKIDHALVEQTGQDILDGFYREALEDDAVKGSPDVARFIEDNLIQGDHFRGTYPKKEALEKNLLTEKQLAALTDKHRLLRIVPHSDTTRVELIHDRLVPVVRKARDERKSKQYQEEQERLAREAQAEAAKLKKSRQRMRIFAMVVTVLAVISLWYWRAANTAQEHAEELLSFLLGEQFLGEIRDIGRSALLDLVKHRVERYETTQWQGTAMIRGLALRNVGDLQKMRGQTKESLASFEQALKTIENSPETLDRVREAARTYERLGETLIDQGLMSVALTHYEKAVEYWRRLATKVRADDYAGDKTSLADSLVSAGDLKGRMGKADLAMKDLGEAIKIVSGLLFDHGAVDLGFGVMASKVAPYPDAKALEVLSRAIVAQAPFRSVADYEGAAALAKQARWLRPFSSLSRRNAYVALAFRGNSRMARPQQALQDYQAAQAELDELRRVDPSNRIWQREQAAVQLLVAEGILACYQDTKNCTPRPSIEDAEVATLGAIATFRMLAQIDLTNASSQRDLAWALSVHAQVVVKRGRQPNRLEQLAESNRLYSNSILDVADTEGQVLIARVLLDKAEVLAPSGSQKETTESLESLGKATNLLERVVVTSPNHLGYTWELSEAYRRESEVRRKIGDKPGADIADHHRQQLAERYEGLVSTWQHKMQELNEKQVDHVNKGAQLFKEADYDNALHEFDLAESAIREYLTLQPAYDIGYDNLRNVLDWIQLTYKELNKIEHRLSTLAAQMAVSQIASWLALDEAAPAKNEALHRTRRDLGMALNDNKRFDEALAMVQEEAIVAAGLLKTDPKNAENLYRLGNAKFGHGLVLRQQKDTSARAGWEEAVLIGLSYNQKAAEIDKTNSKYPTEIALGYKYLADELDSDGLKEKARLLYHQALEAYKKAARLSPSDKEAHDAIRELEERVVH